MLSIGQKIEKKREQNRVVNQNLLVCEYNISSSTIYDINIKHISEKLEGKRPLGRPMR
jgi:hypothetical protein